MNESPGESQNPGIDNPSVYIYTKDELERTIEGCITKTVLPLLAHANLDNGIITIQHRSDSKGEETSMPSTHRETYTYIDETGIPHTVRLQGCSKADTDRRFQQFLFGQKEKKESPILRDFVNNVFCPSSTLDKHPNPGCNPMQIQQPQLRFIHGGARCMAEPEHAEKLLLQATWMDWGLIYFSPLKLVEWIWKVYRDGRIEMWPKFVGGVGSAIECQMDTEDFQALLSLLPGAFKDAEAHHDALDGAGWEMASFDENGGEIHRTSGYIYGVKTLEEIGAILQKYRQPVEKEAIFRQFQSINALEKEKSVSDRA